MEWPRGETWKEALFSAALALAGIVLVRATFEIPGANQGTRWFPLVCSLVLVAGGLGGTLRCLLGGAPSAGPTSQGAPERMRRAEGSSPSDGGLGRVRTVGAAAARIPKPVILGLMVVGYVLLLPRLHYILSTILLGIVLLWAFERRLKFGAIAFSITLALVLFGLFEHLLGVILP